MAQVLIVEDDEQVRVLAESLLQERGHTTLSAGTVEQAIALLDGKDRLDALFTDIGLHGDIQAGLLLAQEAVKRRANLSVLYTSGQGVTDGMKALFVERYGFLAKPYTLDLLTTALENLLGANDGQIA